MTIREKVLVWTGLAVLVAGVIAYSQYQTKLDSSYQTGQFSGSGESQTPEVGSVEGIIDELVDDGAVESSVAAEDDIDAEIIDDDSQEINAIGDSYAGNEF